MFSMLKKHSLIYSIVSGSIRNAVNAHPKWAFDNRFVGSITKRAAGTLMAALPSLLALEVNLKSDQSLSSEINGRDKNLVFVRKARMTPRPRKGLGVSQYKPWQASLKVLHCALGAAVSQAQKNGDTEKAETLIAVLRLIRHMLNQNEISGKKYDLEPFLSSQKSTDHPIPGSSIDS